MYIIWNINIPYISIILCITIGESQAGLAHCSMIVQYSLDLNIYAIKLHQLNLSPIKKHLHSDCKIWKLLYNHITMSEAGLPSSYGYTLYCADTL